MTRRTQKPEARKVPRGRSPLNLTCVQRLETPGCYYAAGIFARAPEFVFQVHLAGEPVAARIVRWCPGGELFVPNLKEVLWSRTQDRIRSDFDRLTTTGGYSVREAIFELGIKHGCSGTAVQRALKRPNHVLGEAAAAAPVQTCLF